MFNNIGLYLTAYNYTGNGTYTGIVTQFITETISTIFNISHIDRV